MTSQSEFNQVHNWSNGQLSHSTSIQSHHIILLQTIFIVDHYKRQCNCNSLKTKIVLMFNPNNLINYIVYDDPTQSAELLVGSGLDCDMSTTPQSLSVAVLTNKLQWSSVLVIESLMCICLQRPQHLMIITIQFLPQKKLHFVSNSKVGFKILLHPPLIVIFDFLFFSR